MKLSVIFKQYATVAVLAFIIVLCACGSSSSTANPNSVTGKWSITLFDSTNTAAYVFTTTLNQQNGSPTTTSAITGSNLNLTTTISSCFQGSSNATQTGVYTVNGVFNGVTTNIVQLTINGNPGTLDLTGTFTTNAVSGSWKFDTGSPCTNQSGTFLMTRV